MSHFSESYSSQDTTNDAQPVAPQRRKVGGAFDELERYCEAEMARLGQEFTEVTERLTESRAESEVALKEHLAFEADDDATASESSPHQEPVVAQTEVSPGESDNHEPEAMSENVRKCPIFRRKVLPKPPRLPDDPNEDDIIAATAHLTLSVPQKIALAALVCGQTGLAAAQRAGISPRTLYRWRQEPIFSETLEELADIAIEASATRMRTLLLRSTHVISDSLLHSDRERWAMRIIACPQVWKMGARRERAAEPKGK